MAERVFVFQSSVDGAMAVVVDIGVESARATARRVLGVPPDEVAQLMGVADKDVALVINSSMSFRLRAA